MGSETRPYRGSAVALGLILALLGWRIAADGVRALEKWDAISRGFALCGVLWVVAGGLMLVGGVWGAFSRNRFPVVVASSAAVVAGATSVTGLLTSVIPCAGPS
jgi:hypothetical protein